MAKGRQKKNTNKIQLSDAKLTTIHQRLPEKKAEAARAAALANEVNMQHQNLISSPQTSAANTPPSMILTTQTPGSVQNSKNDQISGSTAGKAMEQCLSMPPSTN